MLSTTGRVRSVFMQKNAMGNEQCKLDAFAKLCSQCALPPTPWLSTQHGIQQGSSPRSGGIVFLQNRKKAKDLATKIPFVSA